MSTPATGTPPKPQKRLRERTKARKQAIQQEDGSLSDARRQLEDAVHALCGPQAYTIDGHIVWLDSTYQQLRDAIDGHRGGRGRSQPSSLVPGFIDAMMLCIRIDLRTNQLDPGPDTPTRLLNIAERPWRPGDVKFMETIAAEILAWVKAARDLFSPKPIYLPDPCPHCKQSQTYRWNDEGERVRTPALMLTAEAGATCLSCHDSWSPDRLIWLGRILGYKSPEGVISA